MNYLSDVTSHQRLSLQHNEDRLSWLSCQSFCEDSEDVGASTDKENERLANTVFHSAHQSRRSMMEHKASFNRRRRVRFAVGSFSVAPADEFDKDNRKQTVQATVHYLQALTEEDKRALFYTPIDYQRMMSEYYLEQIQQLVNAANLSIAKEDGTYQTDSDSEDESETDGSEDSKLSEDYYV